MVTALDTRHSLNWLSPSPMWSAYGDLSIADNRRRFAQPVILRFNNDTFMEEFMNTLTLAPEKLAQWKARWETWEQPMANPSVDHIAHNEPLVQRVFEQTRSPMLLERKKSSGKIVVSPVVEDDSEQPLKLYQPLQNRYYLVSASLVCQQPGLPDRQVDHGKQEQVGFVIRRHIAPPNDVSDDPLSWDEYAYVQTENGPRWQIINAASQALLQSGEERVPMFSLGYTDLGNNSRRVFSGLLPIGRREAYLGAAVVEDPVNDAAAANASDTTPDSRILLFALQVTGPWRELINAAQAKRLTFQNWPTGDGDSGNSSVQKMTESIALRERIQTNSWYILLDFVLFLRVHIEPVWEVLINPILRSTLAPKYENLYAYLEKIQLSPFYLTSLSTMLNDPVLAGSSYNDSNITTQFIDALKTIAKSQSLQQALEDAESIFSYVGTPVDWPSFLFPLADADFSYGPCPLLNNGVALYGGSPLLDVPASIDTFFDSLTSTLESALSEQGQTPAPEINIATDVPRAGEDAWFSIRCVYERPNCGPLKPNILSNSSDPFLMASFFDPDAPARAIRIPFPSNITPAALRKYNKSATMVVSDMLCGQLKRIRRLSLGDLVLSVLPWPFHKDLPSVGPGGSCSDGSNSLGMLCSLSIPIVTLCALILLFIIVALFDIFFRWIPLLFLCFPVPNLGSKK